jgi:hypothetical protein
MTDTPETDAAEWGITPNDMVVRSGLARKLELERNGLHASHNKNAAYSAELLELCWTLRKERDALLKALEECKEDSIELLGERDWWQNEPRCDHKERYEKTQNNITRADAALALVKNNQPKMTDAPETHQQDGGLPLSTSALFANLVRRHNLAVNDLTETQLAEAIRQAMPDFRRYIHANAQSVVYLPSSEAEKWRSLYHELLWAVESVHEGESRHETALRYIREREAHTEELAMSSANS